MEKERKRILVVDDESPIAEMISDFCRSFGFDTRTVYCGGDALREVKSYRPDLITLDLIMTEFSGLEVLQALKGDEGTRNIPVLVISALANSEEAGDALKLYQGVLAKPLKMDDLESKIAQMLSSIGRG